MTTFEIAVLAMLGVITLIHLAAVVGAVFAVRWLREEHARLQPSLTEQVERLKQLQTQVGQIKAKLDGMREWWKGVREAPVNLAGALKDKLPKRREADPAELTAEIPQELTTQAEEVPL